MSEKQKSVTIDMEYEREVTGLVLTIDVGNSNTTIGLFRQDGTLVFRSVLPTYKSATQDQWAIQLLDVFRLHGASVADTSGIMISSVVPPVTAAICGAAEFVAGKKPMVMGPGVKTGLNIKSDLHAQLGSDIVAFSVAAIARYPSPLIVIDMGTAITMSLLQGNSYDGCIIMPGVRVAVEALSQAAAELPHISIEAPESLLGHNTVNAMRSGVVYGNASMIDGMIDRIEADSGMSIASIIATGTAVPDILKHCRHSIVYNADLLLDGLFLIYQKNQALRHRRM